MKIITVCGSLKFKQQTTEITEKLAFAGNCMITPIELSNPDITTYTKQQILTLKSMHKEKIKISDAILVIDINGYIGDSTKKEIEYAQSLNKEIIYYSELVK